MELVYRRKLDEKDSLFYNSIKSSESIDIRDLPEEIRNAVKYDQNTNERMKPEVKKEKNTTSEEPLIDTTGISID